jgi:argininosuccinate lyase
MTDPKDKAKHASGTATDPSSQGSIARTDATGGALDPEFLAWQTSLPVDHRLLDVDCAGSIAHVGSLVDGGIITEAEGEQLRAALEAIPEKIDSGELELPLEEDVHMAVEVLVKRLAGDVADKMHTGRSRNDQVATDLKLWTRLAGHVLEEHLRKLDEGVAAWAKQWGDTAMPAYTHRQVAIPVLAHLWIDAALAQPLFRDRRFLRVLGLELAESPLGAGAIGGNTLPIDASLSARALGFADAPRNPIDAVGQRDHALTLAFMCTRIAMHLSRFCADMVEMCSDGLFVLDGAIACGSSMMPHKRNPDLFELVRAQAALRYGELVQLMTTFQGLGSGYHRDLQQDKEILFRAFDGTVNCLKMITLSLEHMEPKPERCLQALKEGDAVATDLTEHLVAEGMAFRTAYRHIGALVAAQRAQDKRLYQLTEADLDAAGLPHSLLDLLDPAASARRRAEKFIPRHGEPAPAPEPEL